MYPFLLSAKEPFLDDDDDIRGWQIDAPANMSKGRIPRDFSRAPYGSMPYASGFDMPIIPRSEWSARIKEMEETKSRISDMMLQAGIPSLDQNGTNYCWCNAVVGSVQTIRCAMGQPYVPLSPASVAAPIKNYSNQGGWGGEALEYIVKYGVASVDKWPANAIKKQYFDGSRENALQHRVTEWYDLQSRDFDQLMTCLLLRMPVAIGLNWWSHEVEACDPVEVSGGVYGVRIRNSWADSYGEKGFAVLSQSKSTPDDACSPRVTIPSLN